ncbi:MAG: hypothetical protein IPF44_03170 [Betaproteobacteria bacterium]|nr:hypothetical protein [Betaproteobacteria bacterium]
MDHFPRKGIRNNQTSSPVSLARRRDQPRSTLPLQSRIPPDRRSLTLAVFAASVSFFPAVAATFSCPDLTGAVQVNACPTEEELKFPSTGIAATTPRLTQIRPIRVRYEDYRR